jgi:SAM-dependent methyltransferase
VSEIGDILRRLRAGEISAPVALAQVLVACRDVAEADAALREAGATELSKLLRGSDGADAVVAFVRGERAMTGEGGAAGRLERWRALFDEAVARCPETSVAFYSLGDPALLAQATDEIVGWLDRIGALRPERRALDLGCGIGRLALALAPRLASVVGVDISPGMIDEARRRAGTAERVRFETTDGRGLAQFADEAFELVLAADCLPIVHDASAELLERHVAECARVLAPGGDLVALNLTYRGDLEADRADASRLAEANGLELAIAGERPFKLWDGAAYRLRKRASARAK